MQEELQEEVQEQAQEEQEVCEEAQATEEVSEAETANPLQKELEELNQLFLRQEADFDNFRRRTAQEKDELSRYSVGKFITELLPMIDNFERALATIEKNEEVKNYFTGIEMVYKQLMEILTKEGLEVIEAEGQPFDPNKHEAIMQVEAEGVEEDIIVEDLRKGYIFKEKVLRPTMCKVAK